MWLIIKKHTDRFWLVSIRNQVEEHLDLRVLWNFLELIKTSYATTSESEWSVSCVCWCRRKSFLKYFLSLCNVHLTFHLLISFTNQVSTRQLFFSLFPDCTNLKKLIRTPICHEVKHTNHRAPRLCQKQNREGIKKKELIKSAPYLIASQPMEQTQWKLPFICTTHLPPYLEHVSSSQSSSSTMNPEPSTKASDVAWNTAYASTWFWQYFYICDKYTALLSSML